MLVVKREEGEAIVIDGKTLVVVGRRPNGKIKLCIAAPKDIEVHRAEVFHKINGYVPYEDLPDLKICKN